MKRQCQDKPKSSTRAYKDLYSFDEFVDSPEWQRTKKGNLFRKLAGVQMTVYVKEGLYHWAVNERINSTRAFFSQTEDYEEGFQEQIRAQQALFDWLREFYDTETDTINRDTYDERVL